jgi:hypothetical protein
MRNCGRVRPVVLAVVLGWAAQGHAQIWEQLEGDDLYSAFRSRELQYDDGAVQRFEECGRTEYHKPNAWSLDGLWWIDSNLLLWMPPSFARNF